MIRQYFKGKFYNLERINKHIFDISLIKSLK